MRIKQRKMNLRCTRLNNGRAKTLSIQPMDEKKIYNNLPREKKEIVKSMDER